MAKSIIARPHRVKDITGQKFNQLTVVGFVGRKYPGNNNLYWACVCDCGNTAEVNRNNLMTGAVKRCKDCGRHNTTKARTKHSKSYTKEHHTWRHILDRCHNPNNQSYRLYGGRGITVFDGWRKSFEAFYSHVGDAPSPKHSLDRIDNNKGYYPGNVRWATAKQQCRNNRRNRILTLDGESKCLVEWSEKIGISVGTLYQRLKRGWSEEKTLTTPVRIANPTNRLN